MICDRFTNALVACRSLGVNILTLHFLYASKDVFISGMFKTTDFAVDS